MYSTLFTTTLVFVLAALRVRAEFTVYTPVLTQCKPATLNWDPASGPYDVIIVPSSDPCGDALVDLGDVGATTFQWSQVTIPAGTQVTISVLDSNDQEGWSGSVTVQPSDDNSCLTSQNPDTPASSPSNPSGPSSSPPPPPPQAPPSHPPSSSSSSTPPAPTVLGAANSGLMGSGFSMYHFNGVAVVVTALGALAALL